MPISIGISCVDFINYIIEHTIMWQFEKQTEQKKKRGMWKQNSK